MNNFSKKSIYFISYILWVTSSAHCMFKDLKEIEYRLSKASKKIINNDLIIENIFHNLQHPDLVRVGLANKLFFKKAECIAKQRAQSDFCLGDQDIEEKSWLTTYTYYNTFWLYRNNPNAIDHLIKRGFYLANLWDITQNFTEKPPEIKEFLLPQNTSELLNNILFHVMDTTNKRLIKYRSISQSDNFQLNISSEERLREEESLISLVKNTYKGLIAQKNTSYILFHKYQTPFLIGLDELTMLDLHIEAQKAYSLKYSMAHVNFMYSFSISSFEYNKNEDRGIFWAPFTLTDNIEYEEEAYEEEIKKTIQIEAKCNQLIDMGDSHWATVLYECWNAIGQTEKANYYKGRANSLKTNNYL